MHKSRSDTSLNLLGAAGTVTGSKTLLKVKEHQVMIDAGLFQGYKNLRQLNWLELPFDVKKLSAVVLTHAHIDHSGALPLLVRQGYNGPIYTSDATIDVASVLLIDSAKLQAEEAEYANRHHTSKHHPAKPLYTIDDVEKTLELFEPMPFGQWQEVLPGLPVKLQYASHILGAASIRVKANQDEIVFSGDLGRAEAPILGAPEPLGDVDYLVMESTYGNRRHPSEDPKLLLAKIIKDTVERGGAVLLPAFAVGRSQVLLHTIDSLIKSGQIPKVPVFLDSPMAVNVTELYKRHHDDHLLSQKAIKEVFGIAKMVQTVEQSKALNELKYPRIIISASGMATGGRVLHHLRTLVGDHRNSIVFAGFQAAGTRGARMVAGETSIRVFGQDLIIKASIHSIDGFSAHADADQLIDWLKTATREPRRVYLNHGEPDAADALRLRIERELGIDCVVPLLGQEVRL
ncbi:MBL fold metallo-hydrolase RNA specificity domain-containing protein [Orrella daihaiensis]|uniref:MBL fold metallo-hydrolase n=1 Tax=Orrella daihaiensis TaxID=2782176 RepID=A0ABY4AJV7_9BURK|nr:MBL fold metallo-hydrolase [Orrella daihaiensis]UOD49342.1 MBL fold metallo-hydrolase [Orrella daihaiensis]